MFYITNMYLLQNACHDKNVKVFLRTIFLVTMLGWVSVLVDDFLGLFFNYETNLMRFI